jgi:FKBP-type peptidyl-prolyl cis-trans isomerase FkpA
MLLIFNSLSRMFMFSHFCKTTLLSAALALASTSWAQTDPAIAAASKEAGAVVTKTGLVYRSLTEGKGASPVPTDKVKVHYKGTFPDGKEFDSSYKRNEPTEFPLNRVIPCWTSSLAPHPSPTVHAAPVA